MQSVNHQQLRLDGTLHELREFGINSVCINCYCDNLCFLVIKYEERGVESLIKILF